MPRVEAEQGRDNTFPSGNDRATLALPLARHGLRPVLALLMWHALGGDGSSAGTL